MIIVFGSVNVDFVTRVTSIPKPGETVLGPGYDVIPGGKGANQALAAQRAGSPTFMAGAVGDDPFAAIGLGLFCVVGARKALDAGLSPLMASLMGMLTAVGGGIAADMLTARPPMVLQKEIYALAALAGAALLTLGDQVGLPDAVIAPLGALFATCLRLVAMSYNWHLPRALEAK